MKRLISYMLLPATAGILLLSTACGGGDDGGQFGKPGSLSSGAIGEDGKSPEKLADEIIKMAGQDPKTIAAAVEKATAGPGRCEVTVSGDESLSFRSGGGAAAVGTDYWFSEDELRESFKQMARIFGEKSKAEIDREVEEQMKSDPRMMLLVLNCGDAGDETGSVSLMPADGSTYADVPFGPKTYPIAKGGVLGGGARAGEFSVIFSAGDGVYALDEPGELKVTKFDKSGIAGTFSFKASERFATGTPKKVAVQGTFDFGCTGGANCKR